MSGTRPYGLGGESRTHPHELSEDAKKWLKQEKRTAKRTGGKRMKASGATPGWRGDVDTEEYKIEVKSTVGQGIFIRKKWLEKIDGEATAAGRKPLLVIAFEGMKVGVDDQWVAMPMSDFLGLTGELK